MAQPRFQEEKLTLPDGVEDLTNRITNKEDNVDQFIPGGTSDVFLGALEKDRRVFKVAVKILRINPRIPLPPKVMERLIREVKAWHKLQEKGVHPHIAELLGVVHFCGGAGKPGIVLPYYKNNEAMSYIQNGRFDEKRKGEIILNIADGLKHMHVNCSVIHGDMKLDNILFDDTGVPKICDFGFSRIIETKGFTTASLSITKRYVAPEILGEGLDNPEATKLSSKPGDIYALGILAAEIFMEDRYCTLDAFTVLTIYQRVTRGERPTADKVNSQEYFSLLVDCWETDPDKRLRIDEIIWSLEYIKRHGMYYNPRMQN